MHPPENRPNFSERYRSTVALLLSHFSALTPNIIDTSRSRRQQQRHRHSTVGTTKIEKFNFKNQGAENF